MKVGLRSQPEAGWTPMPNFSRIPLKKLGRTGPDDWVI